MNETTPQTLGWTRQADGSWEGMINGVTYLIAEEDDIYYIYRYFDHEQIEAAKDLITAIQLVSSIEGVDNA